MSRFLAVALAILPLLCATRPAKCSSPEPVTYLISGLDYSPYSVARFDVTIDGTTVHGVVTPLVGDQTAPLSVKGSNEHDGEITLTFDFPDKPLTRTFKKENTNLYIRWRSPDDSRLVTFERLRAGSFSDYSLTMSTSGCGPRYGALDIAFAANYKKDALKSFLDQNKKLAALPVKAYSRKGDKRMTFGAMLLSQLVGDAWQFDVPVGSEMYIAKTLRPRNDLFQRVNLMKDGCGGAEASYFVINKKLVSDGAAFSRAKFEKYLDDGLPELFAVDNNRNPWSFRQEGRKVTVVDIPGKPLNYRIRAYVASEISRQKPGFWDTFYVNFEPSPALEITANEYAIIVQVEKAKSVRRSAGGSSPPDESYFKTELSESDEAEITTAVSSFFKKKDHGWCLYDKEGYDANEHRSKCDRDSMEK